MSLEQQQQVIQYVPFTSFVHPSFWHSLTDIKLNVDKLNESTKQIYGRFTYRDDIGTVFEVDGTSFNKLPEIEQMYYNITGTIMNKNTIEDFKNIDKAALLNSIGEIIWPNIRRKTWISNPNSLLSFIILSFANLQTVDSSGWVGWERNDKGNFGPKLANMSASMDPIKLADASSDLNIKLMKWRLVPDIEVDVMKRTKCLLLGAGTLGCHVARDLLAWGFRHITFIDSGKVSYSNPTRQVLFNHQDCLDGGRKKAEAAAQNLKLILPTVNSKAIVAHIPMPGHPVGESLLEETVTNLKLIIEAIAEHDVIFLLLDTREARWLPTVISAHHGKIVINAALGFDSYLVMRHGVGLRCMENAVSVNSTYIPGGLLGCYFCHDVTAPGNSLKDRTLDQQCTVTRPGVAAIAGALAVEVLVALLQHPLRVEAPALYNLNGDEDIASELQGVLGPIPHSIRGFLHSYTSVTPTCAKFKQCIACSDVVINKYREEGTEFLLKVFNSGKYLEEVTGLSELQLAAEMTDILTFSDEDQDQE